ncbi:hypothetical protein [Rufibacter roseus]|uniref:Uncharacterized protein n=1 Tax=Rufibacter roseus TaxID=1567108 RepID=A0ABW2DMB5_9BACT|nr:hypothetical protein [Rufibacter roseus]
MLAMQFKTYLILRLFFNPSGTASFCISKILTLFAYIFLIFAENSANRFRVVFKKTGIKEDFKFRLIIVSKHNLSFINGEGMYQYQSLPLPAFKDALQKHNLYER